MKAEDEERLLRFRARREVNQALERFVAKIVKRGWSATYVGGSSLGVGVDLLMRAGVSEEIIIDAVKKAIDDQRNGATISAFPDVEVEVNKPS